jgi:hypothetical protein
MDPVRIARVAMKIWDLVEGIVVVVVVGVGYFACESTGYVEKLDRV